MSVQRLRGGFVPMLGKETLRAKKGAKEFVHADGTPVDPARFKDIVFVRARKPDAAPARERTQRRWWSAAADVGLAAVLFPEELPGKEAVHVGDVTFTGRDVDRMLQSLLPSDVASPRIDIDAGFFHKTLARWLGVEAKGTTRKGGAEVLWDYDFWKAALEDDGDVVVEGAVARRYTALVWRGERAPPERYAYWIAVDDKGRVKKSGWLTAPPDLLGPSKRVFRETSLPVEAALSRLPDARAVTALYSEND